MNPLFKEVFYAEDLEDYLKNIWKKHPQETSEAYDYFSRYYLSNERVIDGYRLFLFDKGMLDEEDFPNIKKVSNKFLNFAKGLGEEGKEILDLDTFAERKKAFQLTGMKPPPRILETSIDDLKKLRVSIVKQELLDADILLQQWLLQVAAFQSHVGSQLEESKKDSKVGTSNNQNSQVLNNLIKARKDISFLMRRSAGLSDKAQEDIVEEAAREEVEIVYKEKEINTKQFEPIDYASLESFDEIINSENMDEILERLEVEVGEKDN